MLFKQCYNIGNIGVIVLRDYILKIIKFMEGRYGTDQLNKALFVLWIILDIIWIIFRFWIIGLLLLLVTVLLVYRSLSKNIQKRMYENRKFLSFSEAFKKTMKLNSKKWKDRKTHRYVKCPYCKAQLRVKKVKGRHKIHCPKCGEDFKKNIII